MTSQANVRYELEIIVTTQRVVDGVYEEWGRTSHLASVPTKAALVECQEIIPVIVEHFMTMARRDAGTP